MGNDIFKTAEFTLTVSSCRSGDKMKVSFIGFDKNGNSESFSYLQSPYHSDNESPEVIKNIRADALTGIIECIEDLRGTLSNNEIITNKDVPQEGK